MVIIMFEVRPHCLVKHAFQKGKRKECDITKQREIVPASIPSHALMSVAYLYNWRCSVFNLLPGYPFWVSLFLHNLLIFLGFAHEDLQRSVPEFFFSIFAS